MSDIAVGDELRRYAPGAGEAVARQSLKVKLATDLGVGATRVRHIVAVERHHVRQQVCRPVAV